MPDCIEVLIREWLETVLVHLWEAEVSANWAELSPGSPHLSGQKVPNLAHIADVLN